MTNIRIEYIPNCVKERTEFKMRKNVLVQDFWGVAPPKYTLKMSVNFQMYSMYGKKSVEGRRTNLLHGTLCLEEDPSTKELAKNATNAPNVHSCCVVSRPHQDFRRAIILRHYFLSHVLVLIRFFHSGQTEVADLFAGNTVSFRIIININTEKFTKFPFSLDFVAPFLLFFFFCKRIC